MLINHCILECNAMCSQEHRSRSIVSILPVLGYCSQAHRHRSTDRSTRLLVLHLPAHKSKADVTMIALPGRVQGGSFKKILAEGQGRSIDRSTCLVVLHLPAHQSKAIFARPMARPELNENLLVFGRFLNILPSRTRRERYARGAAEGYAASAQAARAPFERRPR